MKTSYIGDELKVTAKSREDKLLLSVIAKVAEEMSYIVELADDRVKAAQRQMHETIADYKYKEEPKGLVSRIISWVRGLR